MSKVTLHRVIPLATAGLREVKVQRDAAYTLGAREVSLSAAGMWVAVDGDAVDLTTTAATTRGVRSVWVEAEVDGAWVLIRPDTDPSLEGAHVPRIEIEVVFDAARSAKNE